MPYLTISGLFVEIWTVCSPEEAQGNEKALMNACPSAGHLDPEISRYSVVLKKKKKLKEQVHEENDGKSIVRVHIEHMVQRKSRNKVVEGNKW